MELRGIYLDNILNTVIASMSFGFRMILSCYAPRTLSPRNRPRLAHPLLLDSLLKFSVRVIFCSKLNYTITDWS